MRWRAAREVPSVVVAVSVVSSFCVLCLVYLSFVCSRPCSCCRSERRVNNSVCSCHGCYTHIGRCGLIEKWCIVCTLFLSFIFSGEEAGVAMGWQCSLWSSPVARVTYPFFSSSFLLPLSFSDHSGHRRRDRRLMWDSEKLYLTSPPCPPFLYPLFWPFPHPSVPLLLFSGHRRRDMQIRSGRQPNRLSRRPTAVQQAAFPAT